MHHAVQPIQLLAELLLLALSTVLVTCVLVIVAVGFVSFGLLVGVPALALFKKRRHLFWALPLANFLLFLSLYPLINNWMNADKITFLDQFQFPLPDTTIQAFLYVTPMGWISAMLLMPVQLLLRWGRSSGSQSTADGNHFLRQYLSRPQALSTWSAFQEGLLAPLFGFGYLCRYPRLWRYAIIPIVLNLLITGIALLLFLVVVIGFLTYLHPAFPPGWGWVALEVLCAVLLFLVVLGATFVTWIILQAMLCGYYYENLARHVELQLGMQPEELSGLSFREQTVDTLFGLFSLVAVNIGLLLLHLVPVFGSIIGVIGSVLISCYMLGAAYFSFPLSLRQRHRKERAQFTRQFRVETAGLGMAVLLVALLPVISSVVLTTAVVGAVLLHRRLESRAAVDRPISEQYDEIGL